MDEEIQEALYEIPFQHQEETLEHSFHLTR
jgi:hypothetical protein